MRGFVDDHGHAGLPGTGLRPRAHDGRWQGRRIARPVPCPSAGRDQTWRPTPHGRVWPAPAACAYRRHPAECLRPVDFSASISRRTCSTAVASSGLPATCARTRQGQMLPCPGLGRVDRSQTPARLVATGPCRPEGRSRISTSYRRPSAVGALIAVKNALVKRA